MANIENEMITDEKNFPTPISDDEKILDLLLTAIEDEIKDATKYKKMVEMVDDSEDIEILRSMYLDESKHKKLIEDIYVSLSGTDLPEFVIEETPLLEYEAQLKQNILDEIDAAKLYNSIYGLINDEQIRATINTIITDEQNHGMLNAYLLN